MKKFIQSTNCNNFFYIKMKYTAHCFDWFSQDILETTHVPGISTVLLIFCT